VTENPQHPGSWTAPGQGSAPTPWAAPPAPAPLMPTSPAGQSVPAPMAPPPPPPAFVDLTVQGSRAWTAFLPPQVSVNGWPLVPEFGRRTVPVPPGPVRVDVVAQWWKPYGQASLQFLAGPGQSVPVFYATPYHVFARGAIGHVKQTRPGRWFLFGLVGAILVPLVALIVAIALTSS